jgi:predicted nucleotidyltransferase
MTLDEIRRLIAPELPALRAAGVTALHVFGSIARGDSRSTSDVDVIVDYDPHSEFNLIDLARIHRRLSERLGANVDVVTRDGIHRRIRDRVLKEAVKVF